MGYVGYVRVSKETDDPQTGRSGEEIEQAGILAQRRAIMDGASRLAFTLDRVDVEVLSARSLARPVLQGALEDCRMGVAEGIIVAKLDRLSRSVIDFAGLLERAKRESWNIVALDFGLDMQSPQGELVANVLMSVAQWERRIIGQRTKEALAERKAAGVKLGRKPSIPASVRLSARAMLMEGFTPEQVAAELPLSGSSVRRIRATLNV